MTGYWKQAYLVSPICLPNKDNAAVLAQADSSRDATALEKRAADASGSGVMSAICAMAPMGQLVVIIEHLDVFICFIEFVRTWKDTPGFTNVEKNFAAGLNDIPTLTEIVIHAAYNLAVSTPFMEYVRTHKNLLNLRPYFERKGEFLKSIHDDPSLWFTVDANSAGETLDRGKWRNLQAMKAVWKQMTRFPHLTERKKGRQTLDKFNSGNTHRHNRTEGFIKAKLNGKEDEKYLHKTACILDASGHNKARRTAQLEADNAKASRGEDNSAGSAHLGDIKELGLEERDILALNKDQLDRQIAFHHEYAKKASISCDQMPIKAKSSYKNNPDCRAALVVTMKWYLSQKDVRDVIMALPETVARASRELPLEDDSEDEGWI
ncbi:hypothetical protein C8J56DRAFT_899250 [Mycena floridula]|nr:hypothetical protein C8J56DRAFT_899250 [Mycena floridula]